MASAGVGLKSLKRRFEVAEIEGQFAEKQYCTFKRSYEFP